MLTESVEIDYSPSDFTSWGLSMRGIRAEGRCPVCHGKFTNDKKGFYCPLHLTTPKRFTIFIPYKGKTIFKGTDLQGKTLRSFADAYALRTLAQAEMDAKKFDPEKWKTKSNYNYKFPVAINAWYEEKLAWLKQGQLAPSYVPKLEQYIRLYYLPYFQSFDVREIRTYHIREFAKQFPEKLSAKYKKNILDALRNFFHWLHEDKLISEIPVFKRIEVPEHIPQTLSYKMRLNVLEKIPAQHKPIFSFLLFQGCRPSEVRALKWKDIEGEVITIRRTWSQYQLLERTKTKNQREILLLPEAKQYLPQRDFPDDFVYKNGDKPYGDTFIRTLLRKVCKELDIKICLYEATKHSFGTDWVNEGRPIFYLMKWFGHKNLATTEKYDNMSVDAFRKIVEMKK